MYSIRFLNTIYDANDLYVIIKLNGTRLYLKLDNCVTFLVENCITEITKRQFLLSKRKIHRWTNVKLLVEEEEANVAVNSVDQ